MGIEAGSSTYYQAKRGIVQDGLVLHLDAGVKESYSGGNVWRDLSGNGNNFTLVNGPTYSKNSGGSISFDNGDDYAIATINNTNIRSSNHFSFFCRVDATNVPDYNFVFFHPSEYIFIALQAGVYRVQYRYDTVNDIFDDSVSNPYEEEWAYYSFDWTGSSYTFYINGSTIKTVSHTTNTIGSTSEWRIGNNNALNRSFSGQIATFKTYSRSLSANEVQQNFNATRHRFGV